MNQLADVDIKPVIPSMYSPTVHTLPSRLKDAARNADEIMSKFSSLSIKILVRDFGLQISGESYTPQGVMRASIRTTFFDVTEAYTNPLPMLLNSLTDMLLTVQMVDHTNMKDPQEGTSGVPFSYENDGDVVTVDLPKIIKDDIANKMSGAAAATSGKTAK